MHLQPLAQGWQAQSSSFAPPMLSSRASLHRMFRKRAHFYQYCFAFADCEMLGTTCVPATSRVSDTEFVPSPDGKSRRRGGFATVSMPSLSAWSDLGKLKGLS